jgi:hypothetical protein
MTTETWTHTYEYAFPDGKRLEVGCIFKCLGEKGKTYRFIKAVTNTGGTTWIDCYGGGGGREQSRAFAPERISTASIKKPKPKVE